jgi:hypothetical protein
LIDIGTNSKDKIGKKLSNFTNWGFTFDGIKCQSIESVLQAFKFPDIEEQKRMCNRISVWARKYGYKGNKWKEKQILYWQGKEYPRESKKYNNLLVRLFRACYEQNAEAIALLIITENEKLTHSIGTKDPKDTVLTEDELVTILMDLREEFGNRIMNYEKMKFIHEIYLKYYGVNKGEQKNDSIERYQKKLIKCKEERMDKKNIKN